MKCPACPSVLTQVYTRVGVIIDCCSGCHGTWFDKGGLFAFSKNRSWLADELAFDFKDIRSSERLCPRCETGLTEGSFIVPDLRIDTCDHCEGLWFDKGELERVAELESGLAGHKLAKERVTGICRGKMPEVSPTAACGAGQSAAPEGGTQGGAHLAVGALPNLALRSGAVLLLLYGALYLVAYLLIAGAGGSQGLCLLVTASFAFLQFLVTPFFTDWILRHAMGLRWVQPSELPAHLTRFLEDLTGKERIRFPSVGIIDDGNPNAFTYGHRPGNARLVLTRGLMDVLDARELEAVVAHEVGHMVHWDMVVMTAATLVPMLLYFLYDSFFRLGAETKKDSRPFFAMALAAYICYVIGEYLVLFLSRVREYYADRYSSEITNDPAALSSALVKIAYGLVSERATQATTPEKDAAGTAKSTRAGAASLRSLGALGISDPNAALALVAACGFTRVAEQEKATLLGTMQWDLWNPWALYYELHSTHPLTARRIDQLGRLSFQFGQKPFVSFDRVQPESFWEEFFEDCLFLWLPFVLLVAGLALGALSGLGLAGVQSLGLIGLGIGMFARTWYSYSAQAFAHYSVSALLSQVKVSQVRPVPAILEGEVVGKGIPGLIWDRELVIRDKTGILMVDYRQPLAIIEAVWGLTKARTLQGKKVQVKGWYRRAPVPFLELSQIQDLETGSTDRCYVAKCKRIASIMVIAAGIVLPVLYPQGWGASTQPAPALRRSSPAAKPLSMASPAEPKTAIASLRASAEAGDASSQNALGNRYFRGDGVPRDPVEAFAWYRKAAMSGLHSAQCNLATCYDVGYGVARNDTEAIKWYRLAADAGLADAQNGLALCYARGAGVPVDQVEAFRWFTKAADQGHTAAQFGLANCYLDGKGVSKDETKAFELYGKAAERGYVRALAYVGGCYLNGKGVAKDEAEAVKWFVKGAGHGDGLAEEGLGLCYEKGRGVPADKDEAIQWYRKAAGHGDAAAQARLRTLGVAVGPGPSAAGKMGQSPAVR